MEMNGSVPNTVRIAVFTLLIASVTALLPQPVDAASKTYWPDKFQTFKNCGDRGPSWFSSAINGWCGAYVNVKLPLGAKITKISYLHRAFDPSAQTNIGLHRVQYGSIGDPMASVGSLGYAVNDGTIESIETTNITKKTITKGYRYYITINSNATDSYVRGIKVFYRK
jgi:hypothetical protein